MVQTFTGRDCRMRRYHNYVGPTDNNRQKGMCKQTRHNKFTLKRSAKYYSLIFQYPMIRKTTENLMKYRNLQIEIQKCQNLKEVSTFPVVIGALGTVSTDFTQYLKIFSKYINPNVIQKTALLGTANILRSVLSMSNETSKK